MLNDGSQRADFGMVCHAPSGEVEGDTGAGLHSKWGINDTQNTGTSTKLKLMCYSALAH